MGCPLRPRAPLPRCGATPGTATATGSWPQAAHPQLKGPRRGAVLGQRAERPALLFGHPHPRLMCLLPSYSPTGASTPPMGPLMLWGGGEEAPRQQGDPTVAQPMPPVGCSHGPLQLLVLDGAVQRLRREERGQSDSRARLRGAAQSRGSTEGFGTPRPVCPGRSPSFLAAVLLTAWPVCTHQLAGSVSGLQVPSPGHLQPQARLGHGAGAQHRLPPFPPLLCLPVTMAQSCVSFT